MSKRKSRRNTRRFRRKLREEQLRKEALSKKPDSSWQTRLSKYVEFQQSHNYFHHFFNHWSYGAKKMNIAVVHDDGTENEFEVELCCVECAAKSYGWSSAQFCSIHKKAIDGDSIKIPDSVDSDKKFIAFVKGL